MIDWRRNHQKLVYDKSSVRRATIDLDWTGFWSWEYQGDRGRRRHRRKPPLGIVD